MRIVGAIVGIAALVSVAVAFAELERRIGGQGAGRRPAARPFLGRRLAPRRPPSRRPVDRVGGQPAGGELHRPHASSRQASSAYVCSFAYDDLARGGRPARRSHDAWFEIATARPASSPCVSASYRSYAFEGPASEPASRVSPPACAPLSAPGIPGCGCSRPGTTANFADAQPHEPATRAEPPRSTGSRARNAHARAARSWPPTSWRTGGRRSARRLREFKRHIGRGPHRWGLVAHPAREPPLGEQTRWFLRQVEGAGLGE